MSEKILTVVVPSYNVEAYLEETLTSFIHPDIMEDLEVLVVNDGSTDRTEEIGKRYASGDIPCHHKSERWSWFHNQPGN